MEIRGPVLLPARREEIELRTLDDLTLVGELALPEQREPVATLVTLGPVVSARVKVMFPEGTSALPSVAVMGPFTW